MVKRKNNLVYGSESKAFLNCTKKSERTYLRPGGPTVRALWAVVELLSKTYKPKFLSSVLYSWHLQCIGLQFSDFRSAQVQV